MSPLANRDEHARFGNQNILYVALDGVSELKVVGGGVETSFAQSNQFF